MNVLNTSINNPKLSTSGSESPIHETDLRVGSLFFYKRQNNGSKVKRYSSVFVSRCNMQQHSHFPSDIPTDPTIATTGIPPQSRILNNAPEERISEKRDREYNNTNKTTPARALTSKKKRERKKEKEPFFL